MSLDGMTRYVTFWMGDKTSLVVISEALIHFVFAFVIGMMYDSRILARSTCGLRCTYCYGAFTE
jgi:hypothetical protein